MSNTGGIGEQNFIFHFSLEIMWENIKTQVLFRIISGGSYEG